MRHDPTESQWAEWFELQRSATKVWFDGDLPQAIEMLNRFVAFQPPLAIKRQAIGFRGSLHQEANHLHAAKLDFQTAWELSEELDFERYTLEESAAAISQQLGEHDEAERWCLRALRTAAADPNTAGAGVLLRLLRLRGHERLAKEERRLAKKVLHQARSLLQVKDELDLADLEATCKTLLKAQEGPFSAEHPPTPKAYPDPNGERH